MVLGARLSALGETMLRALLGKWKPHSPTLEWMPTLEESADARPPRGEEGASQPGAEELGTGSGQGVGGVLVWGAVLRRWPCGGAVLVAAGEGSEGGASGGGGDAHDQGRGGGSAGGVAGREARQSHARASVSERRAAVWGGHNVDSRQVAVTKKSHRRSASSANARSSFVDTVASDMAARRTREGLAPAGEREAPRSGWPPLGGRPVAGPGG